MEILLKSGVLLSCKLSRVDKSSSKVTGKDDITKLASVVGVTSISRSEGLISSDSFAATDVKKY
jgi:hypothetical protein